ncbi:MAG: M20/M25/M40 family metallo-hydrolase, partial [Proteobacteria bacterium]|nr:M20/M25/M40 family metallo-hydrolase [Pseudomonadota bacterium]
QTILNQIGADKIAASVQLLENLGSRYHSSTIGTQAVATIKSIWQANMPIAGTIVETSNGSQSTQNNLVVSIPGSVDDSTTVVVGAHMDSINKSDNTQAPGADDDASGVASLTELLRIIKSNNLKFARRLEFHGYGAEEVGLIGSSVTAKSFTASGRIVSGMLQLDMNGFAKTENKDSIFLITTDTSAILRRQLKDLMGSYGLGTPVELALAAGTSDHRSWTGAGYHAVFPFEHPVDYNRAIHSTRDTSQLVDPLISAKYTKLALSWIAHNAGLVGIDSEHAIGIASLVTAGSAIKLGVVAGSSNSDRYVAAGPSSTQTMSVCIVAKPTDGSCLDTPRDMVLERSTNGINLFSEPKDQTLNASELHRFTAYNSTGAATSQRTVKLVRIETS